MSELPSYSLLRGCGVCDGQAWRREWQHRLQHWPPEQEPLPLPADPKLLFQFALPLLERLRLLAAGGRRPVLMLNAPVGAGKTTLARLLSRLAPLLELRLAVASIDDGYLPWQRRRQALAGNPFGVTRVPPGSHDPALLSRLIDRWRHGGQLVLPRFDKTLRQGEGDRAGCVSGPADAVLLEGWLLGCEPLAAGQDAGLVALERTDLPAALRLRPQERAWLPRWDQALEAYQPLWSRCDGLWMLRPLCWSWPRRWRFQAEATQRRRGGSTLPAAALDQLVRASLCSLPPLLYQDPLLHRADVVAVIDARRRLVSLSSNLSAMNGPVEGNCRGIRPAC
jgi:D-glycerate 3-kinase